MSSRKGTWIYRRISHASTERLIVYRDKREEGDEEEEGEGEGEGEELWETSPQYSLIYKEKKTTAIIVFFSL